MKHPIQRGLGLIVLLSLFSACATTTADLTPLLATDDCGPKPEHYREIAAAWFNAHYFYTPPNPIKADALSVSAPTRAVTVDAMLGRKAGWQVILGPQNKIVTSLTDSNYTRLIINRDRVVLATSSDRPFLLVPK